MPSRWEVLLPGAEPDRIRWEHLHAAVSGWFDDTAEDHNKPVKPYSVSPPRDSPRGPLIEIGLLDDTLVDRLVSRGSRLRLGRTVYTAPTPPTQIGAATWHDLAHGHRGRAWSLRFLTPMTFRRGNRFTPLPAPTPIVASLRRSWNTYAPPEFAVTLDLSTDPVWVTDIDGHNEVETVNGRTISGFVGRLRIECDGNDDTADRISSVIRLAPFAGVGAYTTRCFGVTRLDPTWQPRS